MTDDEIILGHEAPLDADNIPNANQSHYCYSCETPMSGLYCMACGQKNDNFRRSIFSLIWETLSSVTALEGRMWRTGGALIAKPGKVAREYADGARTKWSSPVRAYLAMSLLLFGYLSIFNVNIMSLDVNLVPMPCAEGTVADLPADQLQLSIKTKFFEPTSVYSARLATRDMATIEKRLIGDGMGFKLDLGEPEVECSNKDGGQFGTLGTSPLSDIREAVSEAINDPEVQAAIEKNKENKASTASDTAAETAAEEANDDTSIVLNGETINPQSITQMGLLFLRDPARFNRSFASYIPRLMFFMMPLTMLLGWFFIRGRGNALLYDHLVHASYVHAVTYFLMFTALILSRVISGGALTKILAIALLLYLPISAKRMFRRGWVKSIWTAYGVGFIYMTILVTGLSLLMVMQFQTMLTEINALAPTP